MALQIEADFPPALACLKNVDALLRCPICFDFLNISMMTKCSHNFCSLCIRKFLSYKLQCPLCNTQATEQDLRNNRLLDDLVVNFQSARQQLSEANFDSPPISPKTPASAVKCKTPREKGQKCNISVMSQFFQKRPKPSPTKETQQESSVAQCIQRGKIETARTHNANDADLHSATTQLPIVVKEEPMDVEEASIQGLMSVKQEDRGSHSISTLVEMAHSSSPSQDIKPVPKVDCPVCSVSVSQQFINKHLDTCLSRGEKKESLRSVGDSDVDPSDDDRDEDEFEPAIEEYDEEEEDDAGGSDEPTDTDTDRKRLKTTLSSVDQKITISFGKGRRPMGRLVYNLLSLQELKRRLKECHLSVRGSRDQLIKRHREFVHIYNAECDSLNPRSAEDIAKELEANEKMRNQMQGKAKPVLVFSKKHTEKEIDEMHSNYRKQHSSDFSRLIAQVRGRLETTRQTCIKQEVIVEGEDAPDTHSADQVAESKGCSVIKVEDEEADAESSARRIELSASPTYSDVSISSSISDIFGPEPARNLEDTEGTSVQKRRSSSRGDDADSSPVLGKRRRKT